jgi:hypothetical protein
MLEPFSDKVEQSRLKESLARLSRDNGFQHIKKWLGYNLQRIDEQIRWQKDEAVLRQEQGKAQMLEAILKEFDL